jgi:hypothetical protein
LWSDIKESRHFGGSTQRILSEWLKEYTLGELWQKNVLGGRPGAENTPQLVPDRSVHS